MATIDNTHLAISTGPLSNRASVSVTCEVVFTDVEVNAMNLLGLGYTLQCQSSKKTSGYGRQSRRWTSGPFPRLLETRISNTEHVAFNTDRLMSALHRHLLNNDHVLVANRVFDEMIPVPNSYWLAEHLPNAVLVACPDAGHGSLFQWHESFQNQVSRLLASDSSYAPY